jgi:hypothetical protein
MMPAGDDRGEGGAMTISDADTANGRGGNPDAAFHIDTRPLLVGGALMGLAGVLGLAGVVISGTALGAAVRDWAARQEVPPSELARHHWERARNATAAGASAWRDGARERAPRR